jgi:hypothetical protein
LSLEALEAQRMPAWSNGLFTNVGGPCQVNCPAGTVVANVHTRYGEASLLNADGSYTCTGTTPNLYEIACDAM